MQTRLPKHDVVLLGAGHTNAYLIRRWRMKPWPDTRLTCISNFPTASYSGMLPGTLAGQYDPSDMEIDLVRLCGAAGVRLIVDHVTEIDVANRAVRFDGRPPIGYDALSIGIGSRPLTADDPAGLAIPIKPMQTFLARLEARLNDLERAALGRPWQIAVLGGGAAGVEIALCLAERLRRQRPSQDVDISLVDAGDSILGSMRTQVQALAREALAERDIDVLLQRKVVALAEPHSICFDDGTLPTDLAIWATTARPPALLDRIDLPKDARGFLLTRDTLQSTGADDVFVVGDSGTCDRLRRPKSGVFAVRQAPLLWKNVERLLRGEALKKWKPQKEFLRLLNTADGQAIADYHGLSMRSTLAWRLKDWIDRRFIEKYQDYEPSEMHEAPPTGRPAQMPCGGCGSKLPSGLLSQVLDQLDNPPSDYVEAGLAAREDVAWIKPAADVATAVTTDFFTLMLDDPWLVGRMAALNALSDLYAKDARPRAALAMAAVPHGHPRQQEQFLRELLDGALHEFREVPLPIVGGHTIVSAEPMIGFTILGEASSGKHLRKADLQPGDQLVLTKPLGTGVLLAGQMQVRTRADWLYEAFEWMLQSNREAAELARAVDAHAVTDVTGFGLAGHLLEMVDASRCSASIRLDALPVYRGVLPLIEQGVESTLAPGNRQAACRIRCSDDVAATARYDLLFDPQTSGGLLISVPPAGANQLLEQLGGTSQIIGEVPPHGDEERVIYAD